MPTWASAGRTVQRGCEPRAINPLQREKRERGRFLVARDIGTKRDLFNKALTGLRPLVEASLVAQVGAGLGAERAPGSGEAEHQCQCDREPYRPQQRQR